MMMLVESAYIVCLLAVSLTSEVAGSSSTACPFNSQYFISENHTLLPLENVAATSEHQDGPASFFITPRTNPWCTSAEDATLPGQHINLTFTEPVVLTLIQSGGFFNGYVNNFSLAYTDGDSEEFTTYSISNYSENFVIDSITSHDAFFVLESPLVTSRLQLLINGGILDLGGRLCWEVLLFGCTLAEAVLLEGDMDDTTPATTPTPSQTPMTADSLTQEQLLAIVIPVAAGSVLVVLVIVVIGVILCAKIHKNARMSSDVQGYEKVTVQVLHNSHLYQKGPRQSQNSSTDTLLRDSNLPREVSTGTLPLPPDSPGRLMYDVPRPLTYDIPRGTRSRSNSSSANTLVDLRATLHERPRSTPLEGLEKPSAEYDVVPDEIIEKYTEKKDKVAKTTTPSSIPMELETSADDYDEIPDDFIPKEPAAKKHIPGVAHEAKGPDPSHVYTDVIKPKATKDNKPHALTTVI